jgi:hypothetical protein
MQIVSFTGGEISHHASSPTNHELMRPVRGGAAVPAGRLPAAHASDRSTWKEIFRHQGTTALTAPASLPAMGDRRSSLGLGREHRAPATEHDAATPKAHTRIRYCVRARLQLSSTRAGEYAGERTSWCLLPACWPAVGDQRRRLAHQNCIRSTCRRQIRRPRPAWLRIGSLAACDSGVSPSLAGIHLHLRGEESEGYRPAPIRLHPVCPSSRCGETRGWRDERRGSE